MEWAINYFSSMDEIVEARVNSITYEGDRMQKTLIGGIATFIVRMGLLYIAVTKGQ